MLGRSNRRLLATAAVLGVTALGVVACGSSESKEESTGKAAAATEQTGSTSGSEAKQTLLVYSAQGYAPNSVEAFEEETGIPTKLVEDSTGPLLAKIQAEKANPQWGLLWVDGNEAFASMDEEGMLKKELSVPKLNEAGESLVPEDHSFVPTGITMACTIIYDSKAVSKPPSSWNELLESKWAGKIGMNNPAVSGPTYPCVAGVMNYLGSEAKGKTYFEKLKSAGIHISETNGDTVHLLETGQIQIGLIQSSAAIGSAMKVKGMKVAYLPKLTMLPSVIGVDGKASPVVQEEAQKFINWVLSEPGQKQMQSGDPEGDSLYWPVVPGVEPLSALPKLSTLSTQTVDPYKWGKSEASINEWFNTNIAQ